MSEVLCNSLLLAMLLYLMSHWIFAMDLTVQSTLIAGSMLTQGTLIHIFLYKHHVSRERLKMYRPAVSTGVSMVFLVPMTLLCEIIYKKDSDNADILMKEMGLMLATVFGAMCRLIEVPSVHRYQTAFFIISAGVVLSVFFGWISVLVLASFLFTWKGIEIVPHYLPKSFTFGELVIVLQFITGIINRVILVIFETHDLKSDEYQLPVFVCTLIAAIVVSTCTVYWTSSYPSVWRFIAVYVIFAVSSVIFLHSVLGENPVIWLLNFLSDSCTKITLLIAWLVLFAVTLIWTIKESADAEARSKISHQSQVRRDMTSASSNADGSISSTRDNSHGTGQRNGHVKSISSTTRKVFHLFIVLVYIPGLILDTHLLLFASVAAMGLFIILEAARALHVAVIGEFLDEIMRKFVDDRDQGLVFLTHIYLLVGLSAPLWISHYILSSHKGLLEMYSGVLSLGVGDTVACVAGRAWGRTHWPGSKKTVEGTLCSIAVQLLLVLTGAFVDVVSVHSWPTVITGVALSSLVEAWTDQIDNLVLPFVLYPFLYLS